MIHAAVDDGFARAIGDGTATLTRVVLDMADVDFIDSYGLEALVRNRRRLGDEVEVVLRDPSDHIRRLLEITALDRLFPVHDETLG